MKSILKNSYPVPTDKTWGIMDASKLKTFMTCPRKFLFEYLFGWRGNSINVDLTFGSAIHVFVEELYRVGMNEEGYESGYREFLKIYRSEISELDEELELKCLLKNPTSASILIKNYMTRYLTDKFHVHGTEIGGTVAVGEERELCFKIDLIGQEENGNFFVLDHKTTSMQFNDAYLNQWQTSYQINLYLHALGAFLLKEGYSFEDIKSFIINAMFLKSYKRRPKNKEVYVDSYGEDLLVTDFYRHEMPYNPDMIYAWLQEVNNWLDVLEHNFELLSEADISANFLKAFPKFGNEQACTSYFRTCKFHTICSTDTNPLQLHDSNPLNMEISFWNPLEDQPTLKKKVNL